jgi:CRP-like cAMP-binding protein
MDQLKQKLSTIYPLKDSDMQVLLNAWDYTELIKGEVILPEGAASKHIYYVKSGAMRSFWMKEGREITDWIALEDTFIYLPISGFCKQPSRHNIQAIENTLLFSISLVDLDMLCANSHAIERFYRHLLMEGLVKAENRIEELMIGSAQHRYKYLTDRYPDIIRRVPLSYVASFINITQETLSRIRGIKNTI